MAKSNSNSEQLELFKILSKDPSEDKCLDPNISPQRIEAKAQEPEVDFEDHDDFDDIDERPLEQRFPTTGSLDYNAVSDWLDRATAMEFHYELEKRFQEPLHVIFTNNRNRLTSCRRVNKKDVVLRVHHAFTLGDDWLLDGLALMLKGDKSYKPIVRKFIVENPKLFAATREDFKQLSCQGRFYDLRKSLVRAVKLARTVVPNFQHHLTVEQAEKGGELFGEHGVRITWGRSGGARRRITYGNFSSIDQLIRINPKLDQSWVVQDFVDLVVYHEYLHYVFPTQFQNGRRNIHSRPFLQAERQFPDFEATEAWERKFIHRFLGRR